MAATGGASTTEGSRNRGAAPRLPERSSLFGLVSFRPRTAIVLAALTLTVGIVAFHFYRESELHRTDVLVREGLRLFAAAKKEAPPAAPQEPSEVVERVREITGAKIALPRDDEGFVFRGVARGRAGKRPAAAVEIAYEGDLYVLLVVRRDGPAEADAPAGLIQGADFVSGERDGNSFVFWERDAAVYLLVSSADLTRTFDLVRKHF